MPALRKYFASSSRRGSLFYAFLKATGSMHTVLKGSCETKIPKNFRRIRTDKTGKLLFQRRLQELGFYKGSKQCRREPLSTCLFKANFGSLLLLIQDVLHYMPYFAAKTSFLVLFRWLKIMKRASQHCNSDYCYS